MLDQSGQQVFSENATDMDLLLLSSWNLGFRVYEIESYITLDQTDHNSILTMSIFLFRNPCFIFYYVGPKWPFTHLAQNCPLILIGKTTIMLLESRACRAWPCANIQ